MTMAGVRAGTFANTVQFFETVLGLRLLHKDPDREFARFQLSTDGVLEVVGPKSVWRPFTTPPPWVLIVADVLHAPDEPDGAGPAAGVAGR